eukprot:6029096-Pyramimonas_sp.AAC.1
MAPPIGLAILKGAGRASRPPPPGNNCTKLPGDAHVSVIICIVFTAWYGGGGGGWRAWGMAILSRRPWGAATGRPPPRASPPRGGPPRFRRC